MLLHPIRDSDQLGCICTWNKYPEGRKEGKKEREERKGGRERGGEREREREGEREREREREIKINTPSVDQTLYTLHLLDSADTSMNLSENPSSFLRGSDQ